MSVRMAIGILTILLTYSAASLCSATDEASMSVDFEAVQASKYVWRGLVCNDEPVMQPSLTASWQSGISFNLWGSFDQTDFGGTKGKFSELDYTLSYDWHSGGKDWTIGYSIYTYPNTSSAGTSEIIANCDFGGPLGANLSLARDIREANGLYLGLGWSKTALIKNRSVDISGELGFSDKRISGYYYGVKSAGLSNASICIEMPVDSHGGWTITPSIAYTRVLRQSLRAAVDSPDNYIFGVKLAKTF